MFGKLTLAAIPFDQPIIMLAAAGIALGGLAVAGLVTWQGRWRWLWTEYVTSVDHKKIGIMYTVLGSYNFV